MRITDFRHFLDASGFLPKEGPALRLALQLGRIIEAASCRQAGVTDLSAVACTRRPGRRRCPGFLAITRSEVPPAMHWECPACGDAGQITGWTDTTWDLRRHFAVRSDAAGERLEVCFDASTYGALLDLAALDWESNALLSSARSTTKGIVLAASEDELDLLLDDVSAAARHDARPAHARRLRSAIEAIEDALRSGDPTAGSRRANTVRQHDLIYQIQVRLQRVRMPVWRRLLVSADSSLDALHHALQASLGWEDCHLHEFQCGAQRIGPIDEWSDPGDVLDENRVRVGDVLAECGESLRYVYDFGDDWQHVIELEEILAGPVPTGLPRCTGGRGHAPPEDSGPAGRSRTGPVAVDLGEVNAALEWLREREH